MKKRILILAMLAFVKSSQADITDEASLRAAIAAIARPVNNDASRATLQAAIQDLSNYIGGKNLILLTKVYPDRSTGAAKQAVQALIGQGRAALDIYAANKDAAIGQLDQARQELVRALQQSTGENQALQQHFAELQGDLAASEQVSRELIAALEQNRIAKEAEIAQSTRRLTDELGTLRAALAQARDASSGYRAQIALLDQQLQAKGADAQQLSVLRDNIRQLTLSLVASDARGDALGQQATQLAGQFEAALQEIEQLKVANIAVDAQRAAQADQVKALTAELQTLSALNKTVSASSSSKGSELFTSKQLAQLQQLQTELGATKAAATVSEANVQKAQQENHQRQMRIDELSRQLQALQAQVEAATAQAALSMSQKDEAQAISAALQVELAAARSAIAQAASDLTSAQVRFDQDRSALQQEIRAQAGKASEALSSQVELLDKENAQLRGREAALIAQLGQLRIDSSALEQAEPAVQILGKQLQEVLAQRDALLQELESIRLAAGKSSASAAGGAAAAGGPPIVVGAGDPPPSAFSTASSSGAADADTLKRLPLGKGEDKGAASAARGSADSGAPVRPKLSFLGDITKAQALKKVEGRIAREETQASSSAAAGGHPLVEALRVRRAGREEEDITVEAFLKNPSIVTSEEDFAPIISGLGAIARANGAEGQFQQLLKKIQQAFAAYGQDWSDDNEDAYKALLRELAGLLKIKKK
jgi:chromosome segregation ATPase